MFWSPFSRRDAYNFDDSHTAIDVARYIVAFCTQHGLAIDSIQLQAILYCVQVASLKERHCALFADEIEAWPQGPIVRSVYRKYCGYGAGRGVADSRDSAEEAVRETLAFGRQHSLGRTAMGARIPWRAAGCHPEGCSC